MSGAVISSDHADPSLCVSNLQTSSTSPQARSITPDQIHDHNSEDDGASFWAVIDGYVCDSTSFLDSHPGGLKKLLSTDHAKTGHTGVEFGFSFSKGRNAHFPGTGRAFNAGVVGACFTR